MWPSFLTNTLIYAAFMALGVAVLALFVAAYHVFGKNRRGKRDSKQDLVNMMILFQTMRDIVEQQKDLARDLNRSLDKKVAYIRDTVDTALRDVETLRDAVKELSRLVNEARSEWGGAREGLTEEGVRVSKVEEARAAEVGEEPERPVLQVLAKPMAPAPKDDVIDAWVGLDFGGDVPDPNAFEVPEEVPETADDADAAREAFRALLNLEPQPGPRKEPKRSGVTGSKREGVQSRASDGGNGKMNALHARVYEYADAGMGVNQIARELGLGKGEVRLILGLRRERES